MEWERKYIDRLGFDLTAEVTREFYPNLELGLGLSYQDHGRPEYIRNGNDKGGIFDIEAPIHVSNVKKIEEKKETRKTTKKESKSK